jgi:hypothetical protein
MEARRPGFSHRSELARTLALGLGLLVALSGRDSRAEAPAAPDETARPRPKVAIPLWDTLAGGLDLGPEYGGNLQVAMITTRFVRITLLDAHLGVAMFPGRDLTWHLGPVLGLGGHLGSERRLSLWLVSGVWLGGRHSLRVLAANSSRVGLFLPFGLELRYRYRDALDRCFGIRVYAAYSPLSRVTIGEDPCRENAGWLIDCGPGPPMAPYHVGISLFFGR